MYMNRTVSLVSLVLAAGCAHSFATKPVTEESWFESGKEMDGVVYFPPSYVRVTWEYRMRVDDKGQILGRHPAGAGQNECTPLVQKEEVQLLPDLSRPLLIVNKPKALSSGSLAVTLEHGMLKSVNSETTTLAGELLQAASQTLAASIPAAIAADVLPGYAGACNSGPVIARFERLELKD